MKQHNVKISSLVFGLLVIAAGALLFAFNTGALPVEYKRIVFSWQMLLISGGFNFLFSHRNRIAGVILMLTGGFFLLSKLNIVNLDFITQNGWAIGLIIGGILIICKVIWGKHFCRRNPEAFRVHIDMHDKPRSYKRRNYDNEPGYIDRNYVFGGGSEKLSITDFKGGEINCVFGGSELDLTDSQLAEGVHTLEINSVFGGCVLYVPVEWNIEIRQSQVFGRFEDHRPKPGFEVDEKSTLIIEASAVFGGGEIKCKK